MKKNHAFKHIAKYLPLYIFALIFSFFSEYVVTLVSLFIGEILALFNGESSVLPSYLSSFINRESTYDAIVSLCILFIVTTVIGIAFKLIRSFAKSYASNKMMASITLGFFSHVIDLPKSYLTSHSTGDIIQRNIQDTKKYIRFYNDGLWHLLGALFAIATLLIQIARLNVLSFLIAIITIYLLLQFARHH